MSEAGFCKRLVFGENERVGQWIEARGGGQYRIGSQCIGLERNGELVAGVMFDYHNGASVYAHWAIGDKRALNRDFLFAIFAYPFIQLECAVLITLIGSDNVASWKLVEHLGLKREHAICDAHPSGELLIYTMRQNECRWLNV